MLSALEPVRYLAYRAGFRHAPGLLRRAEVFGHRLRNRELERRLVLLPGVPSRPLAELLVWDTGFATDLVRALETALGTPLFVLPSGTVRAADVAPSLAARAEITFAEVPEWETPAFADAGHFVLPKRVTHLEDLRGEESLGAQKLRRAAATAGLDYDVSHDLRALSEFHERFYLPMVRKRHGDRARPTPLSLLALVFRDGFLVRVFERDRWVSGAVVARHPTRASAWSIVVTGVLGGDYVAVSETARAAAVLYARDAVKREGAEVCDHLVTRPFPRDGLFRRKRTWDTRVEDLPERPDRVVVAVHTEASTVRALFSGLPFLALSTRGLAGVSFGGDGARAGREFRALELEDVFVSERSDLGALRAFARSLGLRERL